MFANRAMMGLAAGCAALSAAFGLAPVPAAADNARLNVTPAVYRVNDVDGAGARIELVRHHGYHGGGRGWGGGYRGYGYRYGGFYRPYAVRPFYGAYYGAAPGYGYGYGNLGYGYGGYGGGRCW